MASALPTSLATAATSTRQADAAPRQAQDRRGTCRISAMRDGRYRVLWTARNGRHGMDGPFQTLDRAAHWCEGYETLLGWRWVR